MRLPRSAFALTLLSSRPLIDAALRRETDNVAADRHAAMLRIDFERGSRWRLGLLGFLLASCGGFISIGMITNVFELGGTPDAINLGVISIFTIICSLGIALLLALWWTGHRRLKAISWCLRLPYAGGVRERRTGGWILARTINCEPRIFARIVSATLLLLAVSGIALTIRDLIGQTSTLTVASAKISQRVKDEYGIRSPHGWTPRSSCWHQPTHCRGQSANPPGFSRNIVAGADHS